MALRFLCFLLLFSPIISGDDAVSQFAYYGFKAADLQLKGSAKIHPNGLLQLTDSQDPVHTTGYAFHPNPVRFSKSRSFSAWFAFAIHPSVQHWGQGMTMVLTPSMNFDHAFPDEYLGLFSNTTNGKASNHIFAIELDTNQNAEFNDIDSNHVGVDVNGLISVGSASAEYFNDKDGKNRSLLLSGSKVMKIWVDYDEHEMLVNVTMAPVEVSKPRRRLLSTRVDLSRVLEDSMYVGFSASTTFTECYHFVLGWSWNQTGSAKSLDPSRLPSLPKFKTNDGSSPSKMFIALLITTLFLSAAIIGSIYAVWKGKYEELWEAWEEDLAPCRFTYRDLYKATKGFKSTEVVGAGGFGKVYRGTLPAPSNNLQVAVKKVTHETEQGMRAFVTEIVSTRRLRHKNLVPLLGYCRRKGELLLVYEFMANGSLDKFLFGNKKPILGWRQRVKIIKEVASALLYLHEESIQVVLHRDLKASNVLLDEDMSSRLSDFGLARLYDHGTNPHTTHVVGTVGYLAPEFAKTGRASKSSDVYSFGAFVLEVACGRRPLEIEEEDEDLVEWVYRKWKEGLILTTSDPKLEGNYDSDEMEMVLKMGLLCSHSNPESRPGIRLVVQCLDGVTAMPDIPADFDSGNSMRSSSSMYGFHKGMSYSYASFDSILQNGR